MPIFVGILKNLTSLVTSMYAYNTYKQMNYFVDYSITCTLTFVNSGVLWWKIQEETFERRHYGAQRDIR